MKPTSTNVLVEVAKNVEVTREKDLDCTEDVEMFPSQISEAYPSSVGSMWRGVIMQKDNSVRQHSRRFEFMARLSFCNVSA